MPKRRVDNSIAEDKPLSPADPIYTEQEAAVYMRLSIYTLRNRRVKGVGCPYIKNGKSVFYTQKMMDDYLKKSIVKTNAA